MKISSRTSLDDKPRNYPVMLCAALEELAGDKDVQERRVLARRFEQWAAQLFLSAQLIEAANPKAAEPANLEDVICEADPQSGLNGKTAAECLAEAARLEERSEKIRHGLIVAGLISPDTEQAERQQFVFPN